MREGILGKSLEDALQTLLERYPKIIPGAQIDPASEDPPRFVLLRREMPIGGWSLDHLYVDQRGVLTLVETKLFQNPESRREVIGQIIEYAANAADRWASGQARQHAAEFWSKKDKELDEVLHEEFGDLDIEEFWHTVETNLKNGRMRLIIAADDLRPEVRRMIEYLNAEMANTEVLGLEMKCYGEEPAPLVLAPRLVGQTQATADRRSSGRDVTQWKVGSLRVALQELPDQEHGRRLLRFLDWALERGCFVEGKSMTPSFGLRGKGDTRIVTLSSNDYPYLFVGESRYPDGLENRDALMDELKALRVIDENLDIEGASSRRWSRQIWDLDDSELNQLLEVLARHCG
jgi:hypothetical protein